jgi:nucleoside-diphosphate-sugar epimerase
VHRREPHAGAAGSVDAFIAHDLTRPIPETGPGHDVVVHCAALSSPWASPPPIADRNVEATANVPRYAQAPVVGGARASSFISSSSVYYRHGDQVGITEDTPLPAIADQRLRATKRAARSWCARRRFHVILRPRAVFGPGDTVLFPASCAPRAAAACRASRDATASRRAAISSSSTT